ncbi:MAG: hypothetical protein ACPHY8_00370 [Patescibacteria group bacterium]
MSDILILDNDSQDNQKQNNKKDSNKHDSDKPKSLMDKINLYLLSMQKIKTKDKVLFYRLLATMTNAGMSVLKSVIVLEKQEKNQAIKMILAKFIE